MANLLFALTMHNLITITELLNDQIKHIVLEQSACIIIMFFDENYEITEQNLSLLNLQFEYRLLNEN